jgi:hypothetical protein
MLAPEPQVGECGGSDPMFMLLLTLPEVCRELWDPSRELWDPSQLSAITDGMVPVENESL